MSNALDGSLLSRYSGAYEVALYCSSSTRHRLDDLIIHDSSLVSPVCRTRVLLKLTASAVLLFGINFWFLWSSPAHYCETENKLLKRENPRCTLSPVHGLEEVGVLFFLSFVLDVRTTKPIIIILDCAFVLYYLFYFVHSSIS